MKLLATVLAFVPIAAAILTLAWVRGRAHEERTAAERDLFNGIMQAGGPR